MSNQQIFPQSTYPLTGDVASTPGNPAVTVQGIQKTPVATTAPKDGQVLIFTASADEYIPGDPIVSGPNAPGTPPTANPVQVGGEDEGNLVREFRTDTYGGLQLSYEIRDTLQQILNQMKALTRAVVNLDNTNQDTDYVADQFSNVDPMS